MIITRSQIYSRFSTSGNNILNQILELLTNNNYGLNALLNQMGGTLSASNLKNLELKTDNLLWYLQKYRKEANRS